MKELKAFPLSDAGILPSLPWAVPQPSLLLRSPSAPQLEP